MTETAPTIIDEDEQRDLEVANFYEKSFTPTKEDLERVMTQKEQIELCLKEKCRVEISRWNPVYEYELSYIQSGRFQRWNRKQRLRMLAHSVNLRKPGVLYDENEIAKIRKTEWEMRKKYCILSLNFWKRQREQQVENREEQQLAETNDSSEQEHLSICTSIPATETAPPNSEDADNFQNLFHFVNTESMSIGSQYQMSEHNLQPSQDVIPPDYDSFNNEIPLTSTQSQVPETEEFLEFVLS